MTIITLTTDLGASSPAAGRLNGVIWSIAPGTQIVELTHEIQPFDLLSLQVVLENALPYFPDGVIHLAALSPSAGEDPRPIAARLGPMFFVGPDTGLITPLLEHAEANRWPIEIEHANREEYWLASRHRSNLLTVISIYAPLAAHLAKGVPLADLGDRISDPVRASQPVPVISGDGWRGEVIQIDHFGNLAVNIKDMHLKGMGALTVQIGGVTIEKLSKTFGDGDPGDLIAMIDSSNRLSICVVNGSAAERLGVHPGDQVEVQPRRRA